MSNFDFSVIRENGQLPAAQGLDTSSIIQDLWEAYVDSSTSLLSELEAAAMSLEAGTNLEEDAAKIRRVLHSIKGEAGMCGVMDVYSLCHEAEFAFEELDQAARADMVLRVKDWIESAVNYVSTGELLSNETVDVPVKSVANDNSSKKIKTLVVEDLNVCAKRIEMILSDLCDITFAGNGKEGFNLFQEALDTDEPFQLVTLDIQMPEMDGHETLEAIRLWEGQFGIDGLDGVKIVMTTSQEEPEHILGSFKQGCEAYVVKPVGDKLLEEISKLGLLKIQTSYSL